MIRVSCAIIKNDDGKVLVAQRSATMRLPNKWEFPGGKVEPRETAEESLIREIKEELGIKIGIVRALPPHIHEYPESIIELIPFECIIISGDIILAEHACYKWLELDQLEELDWAEADVPILLYYISIN